MRYRLLWPAVVIFVLSLVGCSLVPERTPIILYELPSRSLGSAPQPEERIEATLRLTTPRASGLLDGSRILVVPLPNQPRAYEGVRWADGMPQLIRNRLFDAFQNDGRITHLVHDDSAVSADIELLSDLRSFHSEYQDGLPVATLRLDVRLIDPRSQQVLASQRFFQQQRAGSEAIIDVVDAFGTAADRLARELVDWTMVQLQRR